MKDTDLKYDSTLSFNNKTVIEVNNLKKSFGNQEVLTDISLKLMNGENLVILGKSGCGKSVLIKCIIGLLKSDKGIITIFDKEVMKLNRKDLGDLRQKVGFLFQSGALYDSMTVEQNLKFPLRRLKKEFSEKEMNEKVI